MNRIKKMCHSTLLLMVMLMMGAFGDKNDTPSIAYIFTIATIMAIAALGAYLTREKSESEPVMLSSYEIAQAQRSSKR